jgi:hypothetical protein
LFEEVYLWFAMDAKLLALASFERSFKRREPLIGDPKSARYIPAPKFVAKTMQIAIAITESKTYKSVSWTVT